MSEGVDVGGVRKADVMTATAVQVVTAHGKLNVVCSGANESQGTTEVCRAKALIDGSTAQASSCIVSPPPPASGLEAAAAVVEMGAASAAVWAVVRCW